jgi:hypothetical protein
MLDEALDFDIEIDIVADGALALDCLPSLHRAGVEQPRQTNDEPPSASRPMLMGSSLTRPLTRAVLPPAPPWPVASSGPRPASWPQPSPDTHAAILAFAGFGDPPDDLFATPAYALRVILRRRALRADLERARSHRSQDVALYEASLRVPDDGAVTMGAAVASTLSAVAIMFLAAALYVVSSLWALG